MVLRIALFIANDRHLLNAVLNNKPRRDQSSDSLDSPIAVLNSLRAHKWTISNEEQVKVGSHTIVCLRIPRSSLSYLNCDFIGNYRTPSSYSML